MNLFAQYFTAFVAGAYFHAGLGHLFTWIDFVKSRNQGAILTSSSPDISWDSLILSNRTDAIFSLCMAAALLVVLLIGRTR